MAERLSFDDQRRAEWILLALMQHGAHTADLVGNFLKNWCKAIGSRGKPAFPAGFLVELGSILWIGLWQQSGTLPEAVEQFPPWSKSLEDLFQRFFQSPLTFATDPAHCSNELDRRVVSFWLTHCLWAGPSNLGADIAITKTGDDEDWLEAIASFLWTHRRLAT